MQVKEGVPRPALQVCSAFSKSVTSAICRVSISWLQRLHLFEATSDGEASAMPTLQVWSAVMISLGSAFSHCVDELAATSHFGHKEGKDFFLASGVWDWYWMMTGMLSSRTNFMV